MSSVFSQFEHIALSYPLQPAFSQAGINTSYRTLLAEARDYAASLDAKDNRPFGLTGPTSLQLIVQILALAKISRPFIYLDDNWSKLKVQELIDDLLVGRVLGPASERDTAGVLGPSDNGGGPRMELSSSIFCFTNTGGSSGSSKLVARGSRATLDNIRNYGETFSLGTGKRVALTSTPAYGPFVSQVLGALLHGGCLHPYDLRKGAGESFANWIAQERVTHLHLIPSVFRHLVGALERHASFPEVERVRLGGETVRWSDLRLFKSRFPNARLLNGYSCSEACGNVCCQDLTDCEPADNQPPPAGPPVSGREIVIVDGEGRSLPAGTRGRIVIRSSHLADGYWQGGPSSGSSFRQGPGGPEFWTEDLGYLSGEGVLYHCGRTNRETKFMGRWVRLDEAEEALCGEEEIDEAQCLLVDDGSLVAYLGTKESFSRSRRRELRARLAAALGENLPWNFVFLDQLPRRDNHKIDTAALLQLKPRPPAASVASKSALERRLVDTLSRLLESRVTVRDNFYELGGSSLVAVEWAQAMGFHDRLSLWSTALLEAGDLSALARMLDAADTEKTRLHCLRRGSGGSALLMFLGGCGSPLKFGAYKDWYQSRHYGVFGVDASLSPGDFAGVEALAAEISLQILQCEWSHAPVVFGWCTGCRVAVEVTRNLLDAGLQVECVLVNPRSLKKRTWLGNLARRVTANFRILADVRKVSREQFRLFTTGTFRGRIAHANHILQVLNSLLRLQPWPAGRGFTPEHQVKRREYSRLSKTPLGKYQFPVTVFYTSEREAVLKEWSSHFVYYHTYQLSGVHETLLSRLKTSPTCPLNLWLDENLGLRVVQNE